MKIKPFTLEPHQYMISEGHYITIFTDHKYLEAEKILRILYQSDGPSDKNVLKFIDEKYPQLKSKEVKKIYHDEPWHFTKEGSAYGIILVMF